MTDYSELKRLAEACRDEVIRSHGWDGMIEDACLLHRDEVFLTKCSPEAVLALISENASLKGSCMAMGKDMGKVTRERNSARAKAEQLKSEVEALRSVMAAVVSEIPHAHYVSPGNSPGHSHRRPGIWDEDNGAKAGKECGWCKVWNTAIAMSKEASQ